MRTMVAGYGVSKLYRLGTGSTAYQLLRERVAYALRHGFRQLPQEGTDFWALRDVSFNVGDGEVVGLIGKNGAGKSTLLKIISQITEPTEGELHVFGRVASLLEVGIGFHPELTGRENVFLNGAILGMGRAEIRRKFDEIVAFSEVEKFIDTPVKRYSSGMYVRLAFAVAAHLESEILIVDEVLAVGDAQFQQKCLGKMRSIRSEGRSVIVVSHNMATVTSLCQRVIWLVEGRVKAEGLTAEVVGRYLSEGLQNDLVWTPRHATTEAFHYHSVAVVRGDTGEAVEAIPADAGADVVIDFSINTPFPPGRIEVILRNDAGEVLLTSTSSDEYAEKYHAWSLGRHQWRAHVPPHLLAPGRYFLSVTEPCGGYDILRDNVLSFSVSEQNSLVARDGRQGKVAPQLEWTRG
jgi:lipopolysaccharide transport system ATP-binding protein